MVVLVKVYDWAGGGSFGGGLVMSGVVWRGRVWFAGLREGVSGGK